MSALIPYLVNVGVAGIVLVLFLIGKLFTKGTVDEKNELIKTQKEQIEKLERALELERTRSDAGVMAANVVKDVLQALRKEIAK